MGGKKARGTDKIPKRQRYDEQEEKTSSNLQGYVEVFYTAKYRNDLISE